MGDFSAFYFEIWLLPKLVYHDTPVNTIAISHFLNIEIIVNNGILWHLYFDAFFTTSLWVLILFYHKYKTGENMWPWTKVQKTPKGLKCQFLEIEMYASSESWINNISIDVWFVMIGQYLKIWNLRVQKKIEILRKSNIEKSCSNEILSNAYY